jgi:hypothetical protein
MIMNEKALLESVLGNMHEFYCRSKGRAILKLSKFDDTTKVPA